MLLEIFHCERQEGERRARERRPESTFHVGDEGIMLFSFLPFIVDEDSRLTANYHSLSNSIGEERSKSHSARVSAIMESSTPLSSDFFSLFSFSLEFSTFSLDSNHLGVTPSRLG